MGRVVVHDSWDEADDRELHAYLASRGDLSVEILSTAEILDLSREAVAELEVLFAPTAVIQRCLPHYKVMACYPACFAPLYRRRLEEKSVGEVCETAAPLFVKPRENDKRFDALVVRTTAERDHLRRVCPNPNTLVYACEVVTFLSEYRLFVAAGALYAVRDSSEYVLPAELSTLSPEWGPPPSAFVAELLRLNEYPYCALDVGYAAAPGRGGRWCVVEVNPPFALSSYGLPIDRYYEYCAAAWKSLARFPR